MDKDEKSLLDSVEKGEWETVPNVEEEIERYRVYSEKQLLKGLTPSTAHADELCKLTSKEVDQMFISSEKKAKLRDLVMQDLSQEEIVEAVIELFGGWEEMASIVLDPDMLAQLKGSLADIEDDRLIPLEEAFDDILEDIELAKIVEERKDQPDIEVTLDDLLDDCSPESVRFDQEDKEWINAKPVGREIIDKSDQQKRGWFSLLMNGLTEPLFMLDRDIERILVAHGMTAEEKATAICNRGGQEIELEMLIDIVKESTDRAERCFKTAESVLNELCKKRDGKKSRR